MSWRSKVGLIAVCSVVLFAFDCSSVDVTYKKNAQASPNESAGGAENGAENTADQKITGKTVDGEPVIGAEEGENRIATFAAGCFWCVEASFQKLDGVKKAISGFAGGEKEDPKYKEVAYGKTDHTETVRVTYDPEKITYGELLDNYWRTVQPIQDDGQFVDKGSQYRPVIFYHNEVQKKMAQKSRRILARKGPFDDPITVDIEPATKFWQAKDYHQDYFKKKPEDYQGYRNGSGRKPFFQKYWDGEPYPERLRSRKLPGKYDVIVDPSKLEDFEPEKNQRVLLLESEWKELLDEDSYHILRELGTEPKHSGDFLDLHKEGVYRCAACGAPLYSSETKFGSKKHGWPSFYDSIERRVGRRLDPDGRRTEVYCNTCDSHLGHVFQDGPEPTGERHCINSLALEFTPAEGDDK